MQRIENTVPSFRWNGINMHTAKTAYETLELLWNNYLVLGEQVDFDFMPRETLEVHIERNSQVRPFRIASWLARQGYFIAAWALWEYYSRTMCQGLMKKEQRRRYESTVDWVAKSLAANSVDFDGKDWFGSANSLRNLIAHFGARAVDSRAKELLERSRVAFPDIEAYKDGYVAISHSHMADLQIRIENFIRNTA